MRSPDKIHVSIFTLKVVNLHLMATTKYDIIASLSVDGDSRPCYGDSGSCLVYGKGEGRRLFGVVSRSTDCIGASHVCVVMHEGWIRNITSSRTVSLSDFPLVMFR